MSLLTIVGNAAADDVFLDALFDKPFETVARYGFKLTPREQEGLKELTRGKHSTENKNHLKEVYICPKRPCTGVALPPPGEPPATEEPPKVA